MIDEKCVIQREGNRITIKGTTIEDITSATNGNTIDIDGNSYVVSFHVRDQLRDDEVKDVYKISKRGDGYVDNTSVLVQLTDKNEIDRIYAALEKDIKATTEDLGTDPNNLPT